MMIRLKIFIPSILVSFFLGFAYHWYAYGYSFKVYNSQKYNYRETSISLVHTHEKIGPPFLDPEFSNIIINMPYGPVHIYKAQRMFQESYPQVTSIETNGNLIEWSDGINNYVLNLSKSSDSDIAKTAGRRRENKSTIQNSSVNPV